VREVADNDPSVTLLEPLKETKRPASLNAVGPKAKLQYPTLPKLSAKVGTGYYVHLKSH